MKTKKPTIEELLKRIEALEKRPIYISYPPSPCTLPHYPNYPSPNTYPGIPTPTITYYSI